MKNVNEAWRWMKQAENDLEFARLARREGFFAQACFISQQAGEKALKSLRYTRGERFVFGHSLRELLKKLLPAYPRLEKFMELAGLLDQYYIPTRYPNGLPDGIPAEAYNKTQAREAVEGAGKMIAEIKKLLPRETVVKRSTKKSKRS
jgi:HEPN domain-containing protein